MKRVEVVLFTFSLLVIGCQKPIPAPDPAILIAPKDNVNCLYVALNTAKANVDFSWQEALNTDSYLLKVRNEDSAVETSRSTENTSLRLTLDRGVTYRWKVVSQSEASSKETESETRYFFLEAQQQFSYLPFPAKLLTPKEGEVIQLNSNGSTNFNWEGADLDNDIASYTLLLGKSKTSLREVATNLSQSNHTISLEAGVQYYWQVVTIDSEGNRSTSITAFFETAS